ncbi:unnamed protein product [Rhizophagus irregularis]|nr:unnamed protein product [Rhizophagus irregularis]
MIRFGSRVGFRSTEPQRFLRVGFRVPKNGKPRFVSGGLPGSKEWKRTKIRSGGLPNSEERKIKIRFRVLKNGKKRTKVRSGGLPGSEERKRTKIRKFGRSVSSEERKNQDSFGWTSDKRGNQDLFGWASEERKPKDKDSIGRLPKNENPKIKISSGSVGFRVLKNNGKPRFVSFGIFGKSGTKIRLVSWVGSDEQKKTKDSSRFVSIYEYMNYVIVEL